MTVQFVNASVAVNARGVEFVAASLGGGTYENLDAYVAGGNTNSGVGYIFRIYSIIGSLATLVAEASYIGPNAQILTWEEGTLDSHRPLHAGGASYELRVLAPNPTTQVQTPFQGSSINVTLAGVTVGDFAGNTNTIGTATLLTAGEATIATANGYVEQADVGVDLIGLPSLVFTLYVSCGVGSVEAPIATTLIDTSSVLIPKVPVFSALSLAVGTTYRLAVKRSNPVATPGPNVTASLATYALSSEAGNGTGDLFVSDIATLRTLSTAITNIQLLGYYASNDGGGGFFTFNSTSMSADDGGIVIRPTAIGAGQPGRWIRNYDGGWINALWFGLVGDGATANDAANTRLVNSSAAQAGKGIFYPEGLYVFTTTVGPFPLGSFIRGAGLRSRPGFGNATGTVFLCQDPNIGVQLGHDPASNIANGTDVWGIEFCGDNAGGLNDVGVEILNDAEVTIRNCRFGAFKYQLSFDGCEVCKAHAVYFDAVPRPGRGYPAASMGVDNGVASAFAARFGSFHSIGGNLACNANILEYAEFNNTGWAILHAGGVGNTVRDASGECNIGIAIFSTISIATTHERMNVEGGTTTNYLIIDTHYDLTFEGCTPTQSIPFATLQGPVYGFNIYNNYFRNFAGTFPIIGSSHILGGHCAGNLPPIGSGVSTKNVIFDTDPLAIVDSGYGDAGPSWGIKCQPKSALDVNDVSIRIRVTLTPANSADPTGNVGDIAWDANFVYVKTAAGWKRSPLVAF